MMMVERICDQEMTEEGKMMAIMTTNLADFRSFTRCVTLLEGGGDYLLSGGPRAGLLNVFEGLHSVG